MSKNYRFISFVFIVTGFICLSLLSSCNEENVITPPPTTLDSNVFIKNNLIVDETAADTSRSGINLYELKTELSLSTEKDAKFIDSVGEGMRFIIRTGDLGLLGKRLPGYTTKFYPMYNNMTQSQFDTLSKIMYYSTLDTNDFIKNSTYYHPYPLNVKPVYGFYLAQRRWTNQNYGVPVYGMFLIDTLYKTSDSIAHVRLDIKINKGGKDQFKQYVK